jgi:hypothetical protein
VEITHEVVIDAPVEPVLQLTVDHPDEDAGFKQAAERVG